MVIDIDIEGDFNAALRMSSLGRELVGWYRVLPNTVINQINQLLEDKIRDDVKDERAADGSYFRDLEDTYAVVKSKQVGSSSPDLHYGYRRSGRRAFDGFSIQREGSTNTSRAEFAAGGGEYMSAHQSGIQNRRKGGELPQRKFFPDTTDFESSNYTKYQDQVRDILIDYLDGLIQRSLNG